MITKKLKNFEYAAAKTISKVNGQIIGCDVEAFETPNGYVFLSVAAHDIQDGNNSTSKIVCERIRYYLDNEVSESAGEAVFNALSYTNGFVFELKRKNELLPTAKASVACILVKNFRAYFAWMGDASFLFFNGKRTYSMGWPLFDSNGHSSVGNQASERIVYLGERQIFEPAVCEQPLVPVDGDILIAGAGKVWELLKLKAFNSILADSMPLLTKAQRLIGIASDSSTGESSAIQLVTFYNLEKVDRVIIDKQSEIKTEPQVQLEFRSTNEPLAGVKEKKPLKRKIVVAICLLAVAYMFYDLFIRDPVSVVYAPATATTSEARNSEATPIEIAEPPISAQKPIGAAELPADVDYLVKTGDTWSKIYSQFEVCSWFIKNHPPNSGKFDREENPVTGRTIAIPVKFSAKKELNPNFFTEFSLEKLGRTCQNANAEYREAFEKKVRR